MVRIRVPLCPECGRSGEYIRRDDVQEDSFYCSTRSCPVRDYRRDHVTRRTATSA